MNIYKMLWSKFSLQGENTSLFVVTTRKYTLSISGISQTIVCLTNQSSYSYFSPLFESDKKHETIYHKLYTALYFGEYILKSKILASS